MTRESQSAREADQLAEGEKRNYVPLLERLKPEGMFQRIILALARRVIDEKAVPSLIDCEATDPQALIAKANEWRGACVVADWVACHADMPVDMLWLRDQDAIAMSSSTAAVLRELRDDRFASEPVLLSLRSGGRMTVTQCPRCHARL